ncbi:MAG: Serine--tRNA ligase [Chloroflexi bacterium]|nr:Serine--tRNA ligase [Chloroflexota bacterium]
MLDIQLFRDDPQKIREGLRRRGMETAPVEKVISLDAQRRELLQEVESLRAERNTGSKEIGRAKDPTERQEKIEAMRAIGKRIDALDEELSGVDLALDTLLATLPNLPDQDVPLGADESENVIIKTVGEIPSYDFEPKPHWDLGPELGLIDFERGVKLTGSRFYVLNGAGARLQRALIAWMLDLHTRQGYSERYLPFVVKEETVFASGQLPKFEGNLYRDHEDDLWLVPTAEVPLTSLHRDEILTKDDLPRAYTAYTACFRREKMSAGRDVRGIKRGHQFDKVEMYVFCQPEESEAFFQKMMADAEQVCAELGLPYRVNQLCTGDLGFAAAITYDIEVWAAGCQEWLEVSSVSNVRDFQARRAAVRYRPEEGKGTRYVHTLNGSGLGLPRTLIAILENYQQADGSVVVPEVLRPWMGGQAVISEQ